MAKKRKATARSRGPANKSMGTANWIEAQMQVCTTLAAARDKIISDKEFSRCVPKNGFGKDTGQHHDRAAAIAIGRQPTALRGCLEATQRRSLQLIYRHEFGRVPSKRRRQAA